MRKSIGNLREMFTKKIVSTGIVLTVMFLLAVGSNKGADMASCTKVVSVQQSTKIANCEVATSKNISANTNAKRRTFEKPKKCSKIDYKKIKSVELNDVTKYACSFVGNKYRYGGVSLMNGCDCSGFTMKIFEHFGKRLPHSSAAQARYGKRVGKKLGKAKPGDLICYSGHVGIYLGKGLIVNASNSKQYPRGGIKVQNARYAKIKDIRRIVK